MNIYLAQLRKDVALRRAMWMAWVACVAICGLAYAAQGMKISPPGGPVFAVLVFGAMTAQFFLLLLLTVQVINADPLVDRDAYWRTRPIPRGTLLAEKMTVVAVLTAGSIVATLSLTMGRGHPPLAGYFTFMLGLAAFAAITRSFSTMLLHVMALAVSAKVLAAVINAQVSMTATANERTWSLNFGQQMMEGAPVIWWLPAVYLAGFGFVIVWQYLTLRTTVSRVVLFLTFLVGALLERR